MAKYGRKGSPFAFENPVEWMESQTLAKLVRYAAALTGYVVSQM